MLSIDFSSSIRPCVCFLLVSSFFFVFLLGVWWFFFSFVIYFFSSRGRGIFDEIPTVLGRESGFFGCGSESGAFVNGCPSSYLVKLHEEDNGDDDDASYRSFQESHCDRLVINVGQGACCLDLQA